MKSLILVGFMGTGKTLAGRTLANQLHFPLVDTDDLIIQKAGKSISAIFAENGELVFRALEKLVLKQLVAETSSPRVIATGGGIVLAKENWLLMRELGKVVCLQAEPETIIKRVGAGSTRPLLSGTPKEVKDRVSALLEQRKAAYAQADWVCITDNLTPQAVADSILEWWETSAGQKGND